MIIQAFWSVHTLPEFFSLIHGAGKRKFTLSVQTTATPTRPSNSAPTFRFALKRHLRKKGEDIRNPNHRKPSMTSLRNHCSRSSSSGLAGRSSTEAVDIRLMDPYHPGRQVAEGWVKRVYFHAYRARLEHFYPWLLAITNRLGRFVSVAGIRPAASFSLFSEHYLDRPVEELLQVPRQGIVEVGNLAPTSPGQARAMITTVTAFLHGAGFRQVVFTAVPQLFNAFRRLGLEPHELAPALPHRVPGGAGEWGSYYAAGPRVYHGDISSGHAALSEQGACLDDLHQAALSLGRRSARHIGTCGE